MPRTVTIKFDDGQEHVYQGVPDSATPEMVTARAAKEFPGRNIANIDGGASAAPKGIGGGARYQGPTSAQEIQSALSVLPIAAGRTGDKVASGINQLENSAQVIKSELTGGDSSGWLKNLANLQNQQSENDRLYAPLRKEFPLTTAVGENLPLAAVPMGQATAMGRIGAPAVAGATIEALKYGSPQERATGAVKQGLAATAGGAVGEVMRRFIQPVPGVMGGAAQDEARQAAAAIPGAKLLPSQATGSNGLRAMEDWLSQTQGGRGPITGVVDSTRQALTRHAAKGLGVPDADTLTPDVLDKAATGIKADYARLAPGVKLDVTQPVLDAVDRAEKALMKGADAGKQEALATVRKLKDQLYSTKSIPGDDWRVWQSDIGSIARGTDNNEVGSVLGKLRGELNDMARGPAAAEWRAVDKRNAYLETLTKPNAIIDGYVNPKAIDRILSNQFGKTYQTGNLKGELSDIGRFGAAVRNPREGSQTFGRQEMSDPYAWLTTPAKWASAKALTSEGFGDYLSKGLLASPEASGIAATLAGSAAVPLGVSPADIYLRGLLGR